MPGVAEIKPYGKDGYVAFTQLGVRQDFAQDLPKEEADVVYEVQGPLAARCFDDKISTAAWHTKPSWYIVASEDRTIPPAVESDSAKRMKLRRRRPLAENLSIIILRYVGVCSGTPTSG
jgi:hypothetical protein